MNNWFYLSLVAPIVWTIVNHFDKYLLSRVFKNNGTGALFIFSGLFSIFVTISIILFFDSSVLSLPLRDILILLVTGSLNGFAFYLYLYVLNTEETSIVVPLLQLTPVFTYLLGYIVLGEVLTSQQLIASLIVLCGVLLISIDLDIDNKVGIKHSALGLVALASLLFALHDVLFKFIAVKDSFINSTFWQYLGVTCVAVCTFIFSKKYRDQFLQMVRLNNFKIISLNISSEILYITGNLFSNFATLFAPVVLVSVVGSYQPLFVFTVGILLTVFLPKIADEKITIRHLLQKLVSIIIIIIGTYLLYSSSV